MAKPKAKGEKKAKVRIIGIRATEEWASWLEGLAETHRTNVSALIDRALSEWSASGGYGVKPPKRTP